VSNASATDGAGNTIALATQNGAVTVGSAPPPSPLAALSIGNANGLPGATVTVPVQYSPGSNIAGIQFDLGYDSTSLSIAGTAGSAATAAGKSLATSSISANLQRFIVSGLNQSVLGAGVLVNLSINIQGGVANGNYALHLSGVMGVDINGVSQALSSSDGNVMVVSPAMPAISISSIDNGASNLPGPIAAGEIVVLQGSGLGPPNLEAGFVANPAVTVNGAPAGIIYAEATQVAAIIPASLGAGNNARIQVQYQGQASAVTTVPVAPVAPGLFTLDGSGQGQGTVFNQDGSLNSPTNPARKGSMVTLFATGVGQTDPNGVPRLPLIVGIGNAGAPLLAAGPLADVPGVLQVQAQVPPDTLAGNAVPLVILIGNTFSQQGVTMAVQ
jgi:uncharacterized protein (TIGR03437 family)